jgi:glycosyltransferase involved in cell wall biosynthesis
MKIALLGNMNNNSFSIMRYFRDLGMDAHLLLYQNDGQGSLKHFTPEADSWNIESWNQYIHQTSIMNGYACLFPDPRKFILPPTKQYLKKLFEDYDKIICSGVGPAVLSKINRSVDLFFPYSTGVEFINTYEDRRVLEKGFILKKIAAKYLKEKMISSLSNANYCLTSELSATKDVFDDIGVKFLNIPIPMVYNSDLKINQRIPSPLLSILDKIDKFKFKVFSHSRLIWKNTSGVLDEEWIKISKYNDWLIKGFASFLKKSKNQNSILVLLEYGRDIEETKSLISELGIEGNVLLIKKMKRKELMIILSACDIGVGEFRKNKNMIWGGTGWEVLASGKPLLQSFTFENDYFETSFGYPPPPILDVKSPECVTRHLERMYANPDEMNDIGKASLNWFNTYNGIGLAKKWLDLLTN